MNARTSLSRGLLTYTSSFFLFSLCIILAPTHAHAFVLDDTGGDCGPNATTTVGVWDAGTLTCTLTADSGDGVSIRSNGVTLDGGGHTVSNNVVIDHLVGVTVRNIHLQGGYPSINIQYSTSTLLDTVSTSQNTNSVVVAYSPNTTIRNSTFTDPAGYGLSVSGSTPGLTLHNNHFVQSDSNFADFHNPLYLYNPLDPFTGQMQGMSIDQTNTINGKPIYYFENIHDQTFADLGDAGVFFCVVCDNITLASTSFTETRNKSQISLYKTTHSHITGNVITFGKDNDVVMYDSSDNVFAGNSFANGSVGVSSYGRSSGNRYDGNTFNHHRDNALDLQYGSTGTVITHNDFDNNNITISIGEGATATVVQNNFRYPGRMIWLFSQSATSTVSQPLPTGGNAYLDSQNCVDADTDGVCDAPYVRVAGQGAREITDYYSWAHWNGWLGYVGGGGSGGGTGTTTPDGSATSTPPTATSTPSVGSGFSSILFLPGIEASRLYNTARADEGGGEDMLWEPGSDSDVRKLFLDEHGRPPVSLSPESAVYTRDVIDEAYARNIGPNVYKSFLTQLAGMKTDGTIADYSAVAYDWRLSLDDVLSGGTKTGTGSSAKISYTEPVVGYGYILAELRRLVASSHNGQVTIVAHSNGGLVAKALLKRLADAHDPLLSHVDRLILVAVPQLGTTEAIGALLHGYDQGIPTAIPLTLSEHTAREFGQNLPGGYNLLPSASYFTYVDTPVVSFDPRLTEWVSRYGSVIHSRERLHDFLTDTYGRVSAGGANVRSPDSLHEELVAGAEAVHAVLDAWTPPSGLRVVEIAGWGVPTTMNGIRYVSGRVHCVSVICAVNGGQTGTDVRPEPIWTVDGDGTVVTPSALWGGGTEAERYWVDLGTYNGLLNRIETRHLARDHKDILEVKNLRDFIQNIVTQTSTTTLPQYISTSTPIAGTRDTRLIYALHSPLTLDMYDDFGHHTGVSTTTGMVEEDVPGTYYVDMGEVKYIFSDSGESSHISMSGYATSTFTFNIDELQGDTVVATTTFADIPVTPDTQVSLTMQSGVSTVSAMHVDTDGDGVADISLTPKLDDVVTVPEAPPVTTVSTVQPSSNGMVIVNNIARVSVPESTTSATPENTQVRNQPIVSVISKIKAIQSGAVVKGSSDATKKGNSSLVAQVGSAKVSQYVTKFTDVVGKWFSRLYTIFNKNKQYYDK